jgi:hypothetical protein
MLEASQSELRPIRARDKMLERHGWIKTFGIMDDVCSPEIAIENVEDLSLIVSDIMNTTIY